MVTNSPRSSQHRTTSSPNSPGACHPSRPTGHFYENPTPHPSSDGRCKVDGLKALQRPLSVLAAIVVGALMLWFAVQVVTDIGNGKILPGPLGNSMLISRAQLQERMRYHGVLHIERDEHGEWVFLKDGRWCRVW